MFHHDDARMSNGKGNSGHRNMIGCKNVGVPLG